MLIMVCVTFIVNIEVKKLGKQQTNYKMHASIHMTLAMTSVCAN